MSSETPHDCHRIMAAEMFNATWELLDAGDRSPEADRTLLATAYASWAHWRRVGMPKNFSVSDWQMSRVWSVIGDAARTGEHGAEALRIAEDDGLGPFYVGYGHEALARAAALAGDRAAVDRHLAAAEALLSQVDEAESADVLRADLEAIRSMAG